MDPISLTALIVAVVSAVAAGILGIMKVIKKSSCLWGCCDLHTKSDVSTESSDDKPKK